ncbi:MAG: Rieske 2Fe-2S domain-containing protein [Stellaceae bacterium]|jgi:nitrite reductase (NADH) small subunit
MAEIFVCREGELPDGGVRIVTSGEVEVGVFLHKGRYFAYRNLCPHQGGPVCEGILLPKVEDVIAPDRTFQGQTFNENEMHFICPWHGYEYKIETGECASDARLKLQRFKVVEREGQLYVVL